MLKFRSMVNNQENQEQDLYKQAGGRKPSNDPRITKIGRLLRRASLDELPQLVNVVRGEMSLIGPRPRPAWMVDSLPDSVGRIQFSVLPGMTGLSQVSDRLWRQSELDLKYCQECSLWLDFKIFLKSIPAVLSGRGAC